ncbi:hypothetical protein BDV28DRAFT_141143 [Aspergillus coremiiformis]|uniref:Tse2 ADP-ribosyltransferase toxin domain-containing protein n=1 Tax=Aspergillus coremiiformis TaxID=138285 RepID=A0A5N6YVF4_9EURO|nr:hypothetical protein BDV28DRAFT_141143 [Aspergillus coremiiformis]
MWTRPNVWRYPTSFTRNTAVWKRRISLVSVHRKFPATMHHFQTQRTSNLYKHPDDDSGYFPDGVITSANGLVYPIVSQSSPYFNGPVFRPNTEGMQEILSWDYDTYLDEIQPDSPPTHPVIITIQNNTAIPPSLTLFRGRFPFFTLQPSSPVSLGVFNDILDEFYATSATFTDVVEWMEKHDIRDAPPDKPEDWMGR